MDEPANPSSPGASPALALLPDQLARATLRQGMRWWMVLDFGAQMLVLVLSPSSYRRSQHRTLYHHMYLATAPLLPAFCAMAAVLSLILIRIVLVTAEGYGLSQYALEVLVRTLVIELLPLLVALFVALRYTMPAGELVSEMRARGQLLAMWRRGADPARDELLPRVLAGVFSVVLLLAIGCVQALVLTYFMVYGFNVSGLPAYTRAFGQIFNPAFTLIFSLKAFFFSLVVAIMPMAPHPRHAGELARRRDDIRQLGLMFSVVLLIEVLSLVGNYY